MRGCLGCILCQERLRLSSKVAECKPLPRRSRAWRRWSSRPGRMVIANKQDLLTQETGSTHHKLITCQHSGGRVIENKPTRTNNIGRARAHSTYHLQGE